MLKVKLILYTYTRITKDKRFWTEISSTLKSFIFYYESDSIKFNNFVSSPIQTLIRDRNKLAGKIGEWTSCYDSQTIYFYHITPK